MTRAIGIVASLVVAIACGCANSPRPDSENERAKLDNAVAAAMNSFTQTDPGFQAMLDSAAGYAVFPEIGKGGVIIGGAYGQGEVFESKSMIGYCDIAQGTIGAQLGGQTFTEILVFKDKFALANFKTGDFTFAANATAVAIKPGAASVANYSDGVAVFVKIRGGLMAEAAVGGQKFRYTPKQP